MFGDKKNKIKDTERSLISETVSIEGTINSSGAIDVAGLVKGPVYSKEIIITPEVDVWSISLTWTYLPAAIALTRLMSLVSA